VSCASWIADGKWPLETLHGDRERLVQKNRVFRPPLSMDLFSKGVYGQFRGRDFQSGNAGALSGVSATIPTPTRPRESSTLRAKHGETPLEPHSHVTRPQAKHRKRGRRGSKMTPEASSSDLCGNFVSRTDWPLFGAIKKRGRRRVNSRSPPAVDPVGPGNHGETRRNQNGTFTKRF